MISPRNSAPNMEAAAINQAVKTSGQVASARERSYARVAAVPAANLSLIVIQMVGALACRQHLGWTAGIRPNLLQRELHVVGLAFYLDRACHLGSRLHLEIAL